jgi:copper chaperone
MKMKQYQFKTNINCSGCVAKVTPVLDNNEEIKEWNVDTANPSKVLTVQAENLSEAQIKELVAKAGFTADKLV